MLERKSPKILFQTRAAESSSPCLQNPGYFSEHVRNTFNSAYSVTCFKKNVWQNPLGETDIHLAAWGMTRI
jgi:hypothetical protein